MKSTTALTLILTASLTAAFTGCQSGKSPLANLAWWNKNDSLASEYIEPPSQQFSPSNSAVASTADDSNLPPLPPDINKTVDTFERDIAQSYRELARKSDESQAEIASRAKQTVNDIVAAPKSFQVDRNNVAAPPMRPPSISESSNPFSNPLTPRAASSSFAPRGQLAASPSTTSATLQPKNSAQSPTPKNANDFSPGSPDKPSYEQLAQQTLQPSFPSNTPKAPVYESTDASALTPSAGGQFVAGNSGMKAGPPTNPGAFAPTKSPSSSALIPTQPAPTNDVQVDYEYPTTPYRPFEERITESPTTTRGQLPPNRESIADAQNRLIGTVSESVGNVANGTRAAVNSVTGQAASRVSELANQASQIGNGLTLNLQGQGGYAPGSVRRPNPIDPDKLVLPMQSFGSSTKDR